ETAFLADGAQARARGNDGTSLAQLGSVLQKTGWSIPRDANAGQLLAQILDEWVAQARSAPTSPHSLVPLFLQATQSRLAGKGTSFSFAGMDPNDVQFSLLELELLLTADFRANESWGRAAGSTTTAALTPHTLPVSSADDPSDNA